MIALVWWAVGSGAAALLEARRSAMDPEDRRPLAEATAQHMRLVPPGRQLVSLGDAIHHIQKEIPDPLLANWVIDHLIAIWWSWGIRLKKPPSPERIYVQIDTRRPLLHLDEPVYAIDNPKLAHFTTWMARELLRRLGQSTLPATPEPIGRNGQPVLPFRLSNWWRADPPDGIESLPHALRDAFPTLTRQLDAGELAQLTGPQAIALAQGRAHESFLALPIDLGRVVERYDDGLIGSVIEDNQAIRRLMVELGLPPIQREVDAAIVLRTPFGRGEVQGLLVTGHFLIAPVVLLTWPEDLEEEGGLIWDRLVQIAEDHTDWKLG